MRAAIIEFLQGLSISAMVVLLHTEVRRIPASRTVRELAGGLVFGLGAVLAMAQSRWTD